jgi:hypothetical protein
MGLIGAFPSMSIGIMGDTRPPSGRSPTLGLTKQSDPTITEAGS